MARLGSPGISHELAYVALNGPVCLACTTLLNVRLLGGPLFSHTFLREILQNKLAWLDLGSLFRNTLQFRKLKKWTSLLFFSF